MNWFDFLDAIQSRPGARVELKILRDGRELTRAVTLEALEETDPVTGEVATVGQVGIYHPSGRGGLLPGGRRRGSGGRVPGHGRRDGDDPGFPQAVW